MYGFPARRWVIFRTSTKAGQELPRTGFQAVLVLSIHPNRQPAALTNNNCWEWQQFYYDYIVHVAASVEMRRLHTLEHFTG